ncbi:MAG: 50S ribosomal protein L10 [Prevotellaceae bacterium]|nr:50S ribosomal protein L10 [Candidatus Colivivens equi]MCQ2076724.1 50S ribosomal protein L10 [Bacteroidaceae bacterium]
MKKEDKGLIIDSLVEQLKNYPHFYIVDMNSLNSVVTSDLRRECFKNEIKLQVVKNTLFEKALDKVEGDFSAIKETLVGPTGIMFCNVANAPAKMLKKFNKANGGVPALKSAYAEESIYVGADQLETLCAIKSKNELIAEVVAALEGQIQGVIGALDSGASTIHGVLDTLAEKGE